MWIRPRQLIYIYFIGTVVAFITIFYFIGTWCDSEGQIELEKKNAEILEHKVLNYQRHEGILKRQIDELKSEIKNLEGRLELHKGINTSEMQSKLDKHLPTIYIVTPTHNRLEQKADLTRLSHTLRHVSKVHWIVVEDGISKSHIVSNFLRNSKLVYIHLNAKTPTEYKLKTNDPSWLYPRGVQQRNAAIDWLREKGLEPGVVYFADDDNTYDLQIFNEMRYTKKVSVWPVGLVGKLRYESPIVDMGKVVGWHTYWKPERQFAMDMAGFAINIQLLKTHPSVSFRMSAGRGNLESDLLMQLGIVLSDLDPKADNCTKILVWHTRTEKSSLKNEDKMIAKYGRKSNIRMEV